MPRASARGKRSPLGFEPPGDSEAVVSSPATESLTQHTCQVLGAILGPGDTVESMISSQPQGAALSELSLKPEAPGSLGGRRCSAGVGWGQAQWSSPWVLKN